MLLTISIHVPRVEDDLHFCSTCGIIFLFQSTSPVWRTSETMERWEEEAISIHVPRVEDDLDKYKVYTPETIFQSTSPVWRTTKSKTT